ncbi:MAG: glyoxalase [Candidatus Eremiobacteraeota bacterium]|nr:glyoxalase [Candidatus Eremiobacteraeota bacterium]
MDVSLITYTVADVTKAKRFFGELIGADPYADAPQYVGYRSGDMEIGLIRSGDKREPGGTVVQKITDVAYGLLVASVKDPNGAIVGLRQFPKG